MKPITFVVVLVSLMIALTLQVIPAQAYSIGSWVQIYEGVEYNTGYVTSPRTMRAFALRISLKNPDVTMYASHSNGTLPYEVTLQTTPAFLAEHGMEAAVNACYFDTALGSNTNIEGLLISNGSLVSSWQAARDAELHLTSDKIASIVNHGSTTGCYTGTAGDAYFLVNGVAGGGNTDPQPRTTAGLTQDGKYLILVCVDGRQPGWSDGATIYDMSLWQLSFGAYNAMNYDGGGSTTMSISGMGSYVNRPCYGYARSVGASLGANSVAANNVGPDSVSWDANRVDIIVRGQSNHVYQKVWPGPGQPWSDWHDLGSATTNTPACSSWGTNRLDIFCRGTDNALKHRAFNGAWQAWESLGGTLTSGPAAVSWGTNRIDVFVRGATSSNIDQITWNGSSWSGWTNLGLTATSNPAACSWESGRLDIFCRSTDNALWHRSFDNGVWHDHWDSLGGVLSSEPAAVSWGPDRIDVVVRGANNEVSHKSWANNAWSGWENLGGDWASTPSISSRGTGMLDVYVRGTNDHLYQKSFSSGAWGGWIDLGPYFD